MYCQHACLTLEISEPLVPPELSDLAVDFDADACGVKAFQSCKACSCSCRRSGLACLVVS
jgi:hypothetical protein